MATAVAPVRVSPLIKTARWTFFTLGFMYGLSRCRTLTKREDRRREEEARLAPIRAAQLAEEKARLNRAEMIYLAEQSGVKVPKDF